MNDINQPPRAPSGNFFTSKPFLVLATTAVLLCGGIFLFKSLLSNTTLSFELSLDAKALPGNKTPVVQVDGQSFSSGNRINLGRHKLTVQLQDAETLERHVWILFGRKNLGVLPLESSKGTLAITVTPSPAKVVLKGGGEVVREGTSPLTVDKLPIGDYAVVISRRDYEESHLVRIQRQQKTDARIELKLGNVELSSEPPDAEFELSSNGRNWRGQLPTRIDDVPIGGYRFTARRKGWELNQDVAVSRGLTSTNKTEFPYGAIEVTSDPSGLVISTNGVEIGKTPVVVGEARPGQYKLTATDGENDLSETIDVAPKQTAKQAFVFRYGTVRLTSSPPGATVVRRGKEVGKTPMSLERIPAGEMTVELRLAGYLSTNFPLQIYEGELAEFAAKLTSERYLRAMKEAREKLGLGLFTESRKLVASALEIEPGDSSASKLQTEIADEERKAEDARKEVAHKLELARQEAERKEVLQLIGKAIAAKGGSDALSRWKASKTVSTVRAMNEGKEITLRVTTYLQMPDRLKMEQEASYQGGAVGSVVLSTLAGSTTVRVTYCVTEDQSWVVEGTALGLSPQAMSPQVEKQLRDSFFFEDCTALLPLVRGDYGLAKATDSSSAPPNSVGVIIRKDGKPQTTLFFDRNSGALVGLDCDEQDRNSQRVRSCVRYSEFRNFSGVVLPTVSRVTRNGSFHQQITIEEVVFSEAFPPEMFRAPTGAGNPRVTNPTSFADVYAGVADASAFPSYENEFRFEFQKVWDAVTAVLKQQQEKIAQADSQSGVIITDVTRHGLIGFPHHDRYCLFFQRSGNASVKVHLKLLRYWVDFEGKRGPPNSLVPEPTREVIDRQAKGFFEKIERKLIKP